MRALPTSQLHVLVVLAAGDAHGYAIMRTTQALSGGAVALRPGSLYAALGRLVDDGLIVETGERPARELDDERRRYYRITPDGRSRLALELGRLERLVEHARTLRLEPVPA
jgi:DNA-binding PadR family transcriptional regulator